MLRCRLGDKPFWSGVKQYIQSHKHSTVETSDFRHALERASGLNLVRFFDEVFFTLIQWIYGRGYPKLALSFSHDLAKGSVEIKIEQTQQDLFEFDLHVEITDVSGKVHPLVFSFSDTPTLVATVNCSPAAIAVDPLGQVLFTLDPSGFPISILEKTARSASDIYNRIWAYEELVKGGSVEGIRAVSAAVPTEPFWGVSLA